MLLPDLSGPTLLPSRTPDGADDPVVRARASRIVRRHTEAIVESVRELSALGLVRNAKAEIRTYATTPQFKLYILNQDQPGVRGMRAVQADNLAATVSTTRLLLLDFDGPVCDIFAGYPAPRVAQELRDLIAAQG